MNNLVRKITVAVTTSLAKGAGANGMAYLGLGGREFRLDIAEHDDFGAGDETIYELGEDANVEHPERNDPRVGFPVTLDDVAAHPAFIRYVPHGRSDDWNVANVDVRISAMDDTTVRYSALDGPQDNLWLGPQSGHQFYLRRSA